MPDVGGRVAYDQSLWAPNQAEVAKRNAQKNTAALARLWTAAVLEQMKLKTA